MHKSTDETSHTSNFEAITLQRCLEDIEILLEWGDATKWRHAEFVDLAQKIYEKTGVSLSANTLKRVWGKITYHSNPSTATLNALVQFLGYENWANYRALRNEVKKLDQKDKTRSRQSSRPLVRGFRRVLLLVLILAAMWLLISSIINFSGHTYEQNVPMQTIAKLNRLTTAQTSDDIPNTVIFKYDLDGVSGQEFKIQQNWDKRLSFAVDPKNTTISSTYYLPGYWHAKLLVDGQIIDESDVYIATKGWLGTIDIEPIPIYFRQQEILSEQIRIDDQALDQANLKAQQSPSITFHHIKEFPDVAADEISFDIELMNSQTGGQAACRFSSVSLVGTSGRLMIPLSIPGCVGDLSIRVGDAVMHGRDYDLSALGCDFSTFQQLRCEVSEFKANIFLNGKHVRTIPYSKSMGKFAGVRIKFQGRGLIQSILVRDMQGRHLIEHGIS